MAGITDSKPPEIFFPELSTLLLELGAPPSSPYCPEAPEIKVVKLG